MKQTFIPISEIETAYHDLSPEMKKAARFVMENPNSVGVSTVRQIAKAASVKPNTVVRMARQLGYEGYDDFREPFRDAIRQGQASFPDRARWLQDMKKQGAMGGLYADMVHAAIRNIEESFTNISEYDLQAASKAIWQARHVYTLGVGVHNANARNFTYLASTGMVQFHAIPRAGSQAIDDLALANGEDILIAMTSQPYRTEVLMAAQTAKKQGVTILGISDSPASPLLMGADHRFVVKSDTPQFFPSSVATIALLETLLSFVIANASDEIPKRIERFHQRRHELGLYQGEL